MELLIHNGVMNKFDRVRAEADKENPDWVKVAKRIAEQPGCENFPIERVEEILSKPGELLVGTLRAREGVFAVGAMVTARDRPFRTLSVGMDNTIVALRIRPERKELSAPGRYMYGEREICFGLEPDGIPNWMGPGIDTSGDSSMAILAPREPIPEIAVGTDNVNAFFEKLAADDRFSTAGDRLVGVLFQTARLALDFDAPVPTAPEALEAQLAQAKAYYQAAQLVARTIADTRRDLVTLEEKLTDRLAMPRPAIHYDQPLNFPKPADIAKARNGFAWPSDDDVRYAIESHQEAIRTLDLLKPE